MAKYQLAIIGAGQLGSRYLQSLVSTLRDDRIFVVDPVPQSLARAESLVSGQEYRVNGNDVSYHTEIQDLPPSLDLVVVATTADVRLGILKQLIPGRSIGALVLEKVLFQSASDLNDAEVLLQQHKVATWVNCSRRVFRLWQHVKDYFGGEGPLHFHLTGGEWGLACNAIHFLDVSAYLTAALPAEFDLRRVDPTMVDAKRAGFKEIFGTLVATYRGGSTVSLSSSPQSKAPHIITITSETKTAIVDEAQGLVLTRGQGSWESKLEPLPYLSAFMGPLLKEILENHRCDLPTLSESAAIHRPFLTALCQHFQIERLQIT